MVNIGNKWDDILKDEFEKDYYKKIREFLKYEYSHYTVYPKMENIFSALKLCDYDDIKVVIIGQDPYHEEGQAHGLSFSVQPGIEIPPSLLNIYKELQSHPENTEMQFVAMYLSGILEAPDKMAVNITFDRTNKILSEMGYKWNNIDDEYIRKIDDIH